MQKMKIKRIAAFFLALAVMASCFAGCAPKENLPANSNGEEKLSVVSTMFPGYDFARAIAGDKAELTLLLPPGSESHSYEPTAQDIIAIQNCDLFIYVGGESESWIKDIIDSMDTSNMTILSMMELVETVEEELVEGMQPEDADAHDADDHDSHGDDHSDENQTDEDHAGDDHADENTHSHDGETVYDEHVWTSPVNASIIAKQIAAELSELDTQNKTVYDENRDRFLGELEQLDSAFREVADTANRHTLVFADRFPFRYFADEYGFDYFAAFPGCSTDTEPNPQTVAFLIDKVKAEGIPGVFYIEFSNERLADTVTERTGAGKLLMHSCHNVSKQDFENGVTYLQLMTKNIENLREALK